MLSLKTWKSVDAATKYYQQDNHLEYYAGNEEKGRWQGIAALGLKNGSEVTKEQFELILKGLDLDGMRLTQSSGDKHRPGYDLTLSAPKSVSILWACGDKKTQETVLSCHQKAVKSAIEYLEDHCLFTRTGAQGKNIERVKGAVVAIFDHSVSRANDPQLHTHCLLANLAQKENGKWGAIESKYIFREQLAIGAVYRSELAHELKNALSVEVKPHGTSFEVEGVPQSLIQEFSKRRQEIVKVISENELSTVREANIAALNTRKPKQDIELETLKQQWQKTATEHGFKQEMVIHQSLELKRIDEAKLIDRILEQASSKKALFTDMDLRKETAISCQGIGGKKTIDAVLETLMKQENLVLMKQEKGFAKYSTRELMGLEEKISSYIEASKVLNDKVIDQVKIERVMISHPELRDEQRQMVHHLTSEAGQVKIAIGSAGSGKSYALGIAREAWQSHGMCVIGLAPTGKAAEQLELNAAIKSQTIDRFLLSKSQINDRTVLVVDEAGMIGTRKMAAIIERAKEANAKLILVGDDHQLKPIDAGMPIKSMQEDIGKAKLNISARQNIEWQRNAAQNVLSGEPDKALQEYEKHGKLYAYNETKIIETLVRKWCKDHDAQPSESKIIIAQTNHEVDSINDKLRNRLKRQGLIADPHKIEIEKQGLKQKKEFCQNEKIIFLKNSYKLGLTNGSTGIIKEIKKDKKETYISAKLDSGKDVTFKLSDYNNIDHGYAISAHKSQGMTVNKSYVLFGNSASQELAYVALTRHKKDAEVFINNSAIRENINWDRVIGEEKGQNRQGVLFDESIAAQSLSMKNPLVKENIFAQTIEQQVLKSEMAMFEQIKQDISAEQAKKARQEQERYAAMMARLSKEVTRDLKTELKPDKIFEVKPEREIERSHGFER